MAQFDVLQKLGFSKSAITCYKDLLKNGPAPTRRLAKRLSVPQTNLYGPLNWLVEQGFIQKAKPSSMPALFIALPLNRALPNHYMQQRQMIAGLAAEQGVFIPALPPRFYKKVQDGIM